MQRSHDSRQMATLVTGATGFVGGQLVMRILERSDRFLICPVRATSNEAARQRGHDVLCDLVGAERAAEFAPRIQWLRGDVVDPRMGWHRSTWDDVTARVDEVFHCAASVSFGLPLDEAHRTNVNGSLNVFELAQDASRRHGTFRRFHHVSTAFVAGTAKTVVDANYLPDDDARNFRNTYERTKARTERFLRTFASDDVPVTIHRPSIVAGDSRTGATTNWNVLYGPIKMMARGKLPVFPKGGRELLDTVAVDFVVDAMMIYAELDSGPLVAHHLTAGPTAFTATQVVESTCRQAQMHDGFAPSQTKLVGQARWLALSAAITAAAGLPKRAGRVRTMAKLARRCIDSCAVFLPYTKVSVVFDATAEHELLGRYGVEMPAGPDYLATIVHYALESNFGRSVPKRPATVDIAVAELAA